nr:threonine--tRNA ligase [Elusimicrobiales bacterium]
IHRTSLGCYERTLAYMIEHFAGAMPLWVAPEQVRVLPVTERALDYAAETAAALRKAGFRVETDESGNKLGYKIRAAQTEKVPYMVILGDKDMENNTVSVRHRTGKDLGAMPIENFLALLKEEESSKAAK